MACSQYSVGSDISCGCGLFIQFVWPSAFLPSYLSWGGPVWLTGHSHPVTVTTTHLSYSKWFFVAGQTDCCSTAVSFVSSAPLGCLWLCPPNLQSTAVLCSLCHQVVFADDADVHQIFSPLLSLCFLLHQAAGDNVHQTFSPLLSLCSLLHQAACDSVHQTTSPLLSVVCDSVHQTSSLLLSVVCDSVHQTSSLLLSVVCDSVHRISSCLLSVTVSTKPLLHCCLLSVTVSTKPLLHCCLLSVTVFTKPLVYCCLMCSLLHQAVSVDGADVHQTFSPPLSKSPAATGCLWVVLTSTFTPLLSLLRAVLHHTVSSLLWLLSEKRRKKKSLA